MKIYFECISLKFNVYQFLAEMGKKRKHSGSSSSSDDEDPNLAEAVDPVFHQTLFEGKRNVKSWR